MRYSSVRLAYDFACRGVCLVNFSAKRFVHVTELICFNAQLLVGMFGLIEVAVRNPLTSIYCIARIPKVVYVVTTLGLQGCSV